MRIRGVGWVDSAVASPSDVYTWYIPPNTQPNTPNTQNWHAPHHLHIPRHPAGAAVRLAPLPNVPQGHQQRHAQQHHQARPVPPAAAAAARSPGTRHAPTAAAPAAVAPPCVVTRRHGHVHRPVSPAHPTANTPLHTQAHAYRAAARSPPGPAPRGRSPPEWLPPSAGSGPTAALAVAAAAAGAGARRRRTRARRAGRSGAAAAGRRRRLRAPASLLAAWGEWSGEGGES